jgi:signal transduction histidine kinase
VTLDLKESGKERVFQVADQGMGIAKEDVPYIFEPFRRVRRTKADIPGVGLGLSVACRIVNAHGGHIAVETEVAKGTTFSVYLPAVSAGETQAA